MDANVAYIAAVAGIGSAIGGLIGTLATMRVARKQIQATVRTAEKQMATAVTLAEKDIHARVILAERMKWIGTLRDSVAEFIGNVWAARLIFEAKSTQTIDMLTTDDHAVLTRNWVLQEKILLLLNPDETDHNQLAELIGQIDVSKELSAGQGSKVRTITQTILKREWERVKKGK